MLIIIIIKIKGQITQRLYTHIGTKMSSTYSPHAHYNTFLFRIIAVAPIRILLNRVIYVTATDGSSGGEGGEGDIDGDDGEVSGPNGALSTQHHFQEHFVLHYNLHF